MDLTDTHHCFFSAVLPGDWDLKGFSIKRYEDSAPPYMPRKFVAMSGFLNLQRGIHGRNLQMFDINLLGLQWNIT